MYKEASKNKPPVFERTHDLVKSPVRMKDGSTISAHELAARFFDNDFGVEMSKQPLRYDQDFGYSRGSMTKDLGYDVCPVGHQMELAYHVGTIIEAERANQTILSALSDEEIGILMLASMLHDIGESTHPDIALAGLNLVGDIPAGRKTDQNRIDEANVRDFFYKNLFDDVDSSVIERIEAVISHTDTTYLHDIFDAAHVVQTIETTSFAYSALAREQWHKEGEIVDPSSQNGARLSGLLGIARIPYENSLKELDDYSYLLHVQKIREDSNSLRQRPLAA